MLNLKAPGLSNTPKTQQASKYCNLTHEMFLFAACTVVIIEA
jgi:hypothetical protein